MTASAVLSELSARGVTVDIDGDRLRLSGPPGEDRGALVEYLRPHKGALLDYLRAADPPQSRRPRRTAAAPEAPAAATPAPIALESHPAVMAWQFNPTAKHTAEEWEAWFAACKQHGVPVAGVWDSWRAIRRHEAATAAPGDAR